MTEIYIPKFIDISYGSFIPPKLAFAMKIPAPNCTAIQSINDAFGSNVSKIIKAVAKVKKNVVPMIQDAELGLWLPEKGYTYQEIDKKLHSMKNEEFEFKYATIQHLCEYKKHLGNTKLPRLSIYVMGENKNIFPSDPLEHIPSWKHIQYDDNDYLGLNCCSGDMVDKFDAVLVQRIRRSSDN